MSISAEVLGIREIFQPSADLQVPPYQRGYAWTAKEINALLKDLVEAFEAGTSYFLGAMVVIQQRAGRGGKPITDVVDGQQRLTTLTILFAVLRDLTPSADEASMLHALIGHEAFAIGDRHRWRMSLNTQDTPFFRTHVQTRNATRRIEQMEEAVALTRSESQLRLTEAVRLIHDEMLLEMSADERSRFSRWLTQQVQLVVVRVTEHNVGYKVFLVLNHRGKPLSDHDILKSALFARAGFTLQEAEQHAVKWNTFALQLGSSDFEGMLKQIRFLYDRQMRGEFIESLLHSIMGEMPAGTFIEEMLPRYVDCYDCIQNGKFERIALTPSAQRSLRFLRSIHHEGWGAPALKFLVDHPGDDEGAARFFAGLERLAFMLQYCVKDREYRAKRYRRLLDFMDGAIDGPSPLELTADEKRSIVDRLRGRFPNFKQRRALLMRISASVPGGEALDPDADATVEHILPRTPVKGSDWYEEWSRARDIEDLTECIGNFTLLTNAENQLADRKAFVQKLNIYFRNGQASFAISSDLKGRTKWTPDDVRARRDMLIRNLADEWGLET